MMNNLEDQIATARAAYYNSGKSHLTDAEYDALEDELRAADPDHRGRLKSITITASKTSPYPIKRRHGRNYKEEDLERHQYSRHIRLLP